MRKKCIRKIKAIFQFEGNLKNVGRKFRELLRTISEDSEKNIRDKSEFMINFSQISS